jgi:hypothetical protein
MPLRRPGTMVGKMAGQSIYQRSTGGRFKHRLAVIKERLACG